MQIRIFDIDGCICRNILPIIESSTFVEPNNVKEEILKTPLYSNFIKYYKYITDKYEGNIKIYFITGRSEETLKEATIRQIQRYISTKKGRDYLKFYPYNLEMEFIAYLHFKVLSITAVINKYSNADSIQCFDDITYYYEILEEYIKPKTKKVILYRVPRNKANNFWKNILKKEKHI